MFDKIISQKEIHDLAVSKGWWESFANPLDRLPTSLMLMVSELAECLEEYRDGHGATEVYYEFAYINNQNVLMTSSSPTRKVWTAFEEDSWEQKGKPCGIAIELADCAIRIRDTAEALGFDLEEMITKKHEFNKTRPYQHGNKRA